MPLGRAEPFRTAGGEAAFSSTNLDTIDNDHVNFGRAVGLTREGVGVA